MFPDSPKMLICFFFRVCVNLDGMFAFYTPVTKWGEKGYIFNIGITDTVSVCPCVCLTVWILSRQYEYLPKHSTFSYKTWYELNVMSWNVIQKKWFAIFKVKLTDNKGFCNQNMAISTVSLNF